SWKRAKHRLTSPELAYAAKEARDGLIERAAGRPDWVLGFQDETWWARLAGAEPLRLLPHGRGGRPEACYGLLHADTRAILLRFVEGRPVSQVTEDFLAWLCRRFAAEGRKVFALAWDNAAWHTSGRVRRWAGRSTGGPDARQLLPTAAPQPPPQVGRGALLVPVS